MTQNTPTRWSAVFTIISLVVTAVLNLVDIGVWLHRFRLLGKVRSGLEVPAESLDLSALLVGWVAFIELFLYVLTAILFLWWFYRAYDALNSLADTRTNYASWWTVVGFIIPILGLFRPIEMVMEVWRKSAERSSASKRLGLWFPLFWWIAFVAGGLAGSFATAVLSSPTAAQAGQFVASLYVLGSAALVVSAILGGAIVEIIERRNREIFDPAASTGRADQRTFGRHSVLKRWWAVRYPLTLNC